jgi:hypothetical protein
MQSPVCKCGRTCKPKLIGGFFKSCCECLQLFKSNRGKYMRTDICYICKQAKINGRCENCSLKRKLVTEIKEIMHECKHCSQPCVQMPNSQEYYMHCESCRKYKKIAKQKYVDIKKITGTCKLCNNKVELKKNGKKYACCATCRDRRRRKLK